MHNSEHAVNNRSKDNCSKTYHETGSIAAVQEAFRQRFPGRSPPTK